MDNKNNKLCYIPPSWIASLVFGFCAFVFFFFSKYDIQSKEAIYAYFDIPAVVISCILAVLAAASYSFYSDRLEVRIFSLRVRRVYWKDVTGAMLFSSLTSNRNAKNNRLYLIICISPCRPAVMSPDAFAKFDRKNMRYLVRIPVSKKEAEVMKQMEQLGIEVIRNDEN